MSKTIDTLTRLADVLEKAQFDNGCLDITSQGPESARVGSPVKVVLQLAGGIAEKLVAEVAGVPTRLKAIADAIRESK